MAKVYQDFVLGTVMRHIYFGSGSGMPTVALLIKETSFNRTAIKNYYIDPLVKSGVAAEKIIAVTLEYGGKKKPSAATQKKYLAELLPALTDMGVKTLFVADGEYFKKPLTANTKAEPYYGYVCECTFEGYEHLSVILTPNYQAMLYNPTVRAKLDLSIKTLAEHVQKTYIPPGSDIIHSARYPGTVEEIKKALHELHKYPALTCDIEAFSLKFYEAGLGTISFAWDEHNGIAFPIDYQSCAPYEAEIWDAKDKKNKTHVLHGKVVKNDAVRKLVKDFLRSYRGNLKYHNCNYDVKVLIYNLWMNALDDNEGMLDGIERLTQDFDDTKIIAYLATNNTAKNDLKLKNLAHEFAGTYAQDDIKNILKIALDELLKYNLTDCLATWYVYNKYQRRMIRDDQESVYKTLFKPAIKNLLQIELVGMPISPENVQRAKEQLEMIVSAHYAYFAGSNLIKEFHYIQQELLAEKLTEKAKKKVYTVDDPIVAREEFNPNSGDQLQKLIYDHLGYEVIDETDSGLPATGAKTLGKLINHAKTDEHRELFENLIGLAKANKVLTSFIPAFESAQQLPDGSYRLYGNFNLGGTQSGRLSSSDPNLQNIPSGSEYAKIIKACFVSPPGWIFVGADFNALEAVCEALLSRDPNKLKVYIDGFDSHCVNAYAYFSDQMPGLNPDSPDSINSIKADYPKLRQASKAPTFALQYQGTWRTIMKSAGVSEKVAKKIETNYHRTYQVSDAWIKGVLDTAHKTGFITTAFGLKIRTPVLAQTSLAKKIPYSAIAERRSAGNAKTQGYGLLNTRAGIEMQERTLASEFKLAILPCGQIHDAAYFIIQDSLKVLRWFNENLIECMRWQNLPELQHNTVKLGAEIDVFWPDWGKSVTLPNNADDKTIKQLTSDHRRKIVGAKAA